MTGVTVRVLSEEDWSLYREVRLAALRDAAPELGATTDDAAVSDDDHWRHQVAGAAHRLVAERDGRVCGVVSVERSGEQPTAADLTGLWVEPAARSSGVAGHLVEGAVALAGTEGVKRVYYWVGTENARAIGFALNAGFRLTSQRRPAGGAGAGADETEIALVLSLEVDHGTVPNAGGSARGAAARQPEGW